MINIENFNLKIDKKSNKNTGIYYIGYIKIDIFNSVTPLLLQTKTKK